MTEKTLPSLRRPILRGLLSLGALLSLRPALAQYERALPGAPAEPPAPVLAETRLALLMGNRDYPLPFDLPPIPKNVRDLRAVLEKRGFVVTDALNQDLPAARRALERFLQQAAKAPPEATLFFYFSGHGVQVDAANLLLPAGLNPSASADVLRGGSMQLLDDVVRRMPGRQGGLLMAVIDACRTSLRGPGENGLNQVEAPPGCLIAFSTGAGRPAVAPAVEDQNTFYTASLVRLLDSMSDETSFRDLFQLVKTDVRSTMLKHPVEAIRKLAQDPFIADHSLVQRSLAPRTVTAPDVPRVVDADDEGDWQRLTQAAWPPEVQRLAERYLQAYPHSPRASGAQVAKEGAATAVGVLQQRDVRLFRSAFQILPEMDESLRRDLLRAGRGDKDAAARIARLHKDSTAANRVSRYEGWLQYAAALGNGIACYELARHYRGEDRPLLASQWESRSRELGYTPPPTLDNVRK